MTTFRHLRLATAAAIAAGLPWLMSGDAEEGGDAPLGSVVWGPPPFVSRYVPFIMASSMSCLRLSSSSPSGCNKAREGGYVDERTSPMHRAWLRGSHSLPVTCWEEIVSEYPPEHAVPRLRPCRDVSACPCSLAGWLACHKGSLLWWKESVRIETGPAASRCPGSLTYELSVLPGSI